VAVDVEEAQLRLVETVLNDLHILADPKTDRKVDYYDGPDVPTKPHSGITDCGISDHPKTAARDGLGGQRELRLSRTVTARPLALAEPEPEAKR
jgi:hypothetical protein